ncbi:MULTISPECIES: chaplin [Streptomyces]|uniref:Chaplin n=1 Tax=Streptomyces lycii TaxID=2654337 RepID=A0ABQ7FGN5_9ACTN|nr:MULTISPECIES: chaplin [Streptomyces]KAF4406986.1 chaplin [Streptomyces lycii]PGH51080.1 chaplin [Streptomyces sp. Ru87]
MKTPKKAALVIAAAGAIVGAGSGAAIAHGDASAEGAAVGSPGVISGNVVQVPIAGPFNVCGNTVNVVGLLNPAFGNECVNK